MSTALVEYPDVPLVLTARIYKLECVGVFEAGLSAHKRDIISPKLAVRTRETQALTLSLRNQHAVKWVPVMER